MSRSLDLIIPERLRQRHWDGYRRVMETGKSRHGQCPSLSPTAKSILARCLIIREQNGESRWRNGEGHVVERLMPAVAMAHTFDATAGGSAVVMARMSLLGNCDTPRKLADLDRLGDLEICHVLPAEIGLEKNEAPSLGLEKSRGRSKVSKAIRGGRRPWFPSGWIRLENCRLRALERRAFPLVRTDGAACRTAATIR
jgi:hypothetical protein